MPTHSPQIAPAFHLKIFFLLTLLVALTACVGDAGVSGEPAAAVKSGGILFQDDFSDIPGSWGTYTRDEAVVAYESGGLRIRVNKPDFDFWSVVGKYFEDTSIAVDVQRTAGPEDNDFGIICRYKDAQNFYMFIISSDGYYGIAKLIEDQHSLIGIDQLQYTDRIRPGQSSYQLRADCVGDTLALYVDGEKLLQVQDKDLESGDVGVLAGAYAEPGVDILFDNFEVRQP